MSNDVLWPQSYFQSDQGEYLSAHLKMTDSVHYSIQPKMNDLLQNFSIREVILNYREVIHREDHIYRKAQ